MFVFIKFFQDEIKSKGAYKVVVVPQIVGGRRRVPVKVGFTQNRGCIAGFLKLFHHGRPFRVHIEPVPGLTVLVKILTGDKGSP